MAKYFAGGHLRYLEGEWRDDNGDVVKIQQEHHGMWKFIDSSEYSVELQCSECGYRALFGRVRAAKFCPNCGADMRGVAKQ